MHLALEFGNVYGVSQLLSCIVSRRTTIGSLPKKETNAIYFQDEISSVTQEGYFHPLEAVWYVWCYGGNKVLSCPSTDCNLPYALYPIERQKSQSVLILSRTNMQNMSGNGTCNRFLLRSVWDEDNTNDLEIRFEGKCHCSVVVHRYRVHSSALFYLSVRSHTENDSGTC